MSYRKKLGMTGWVFLAPAAILIAVMNFYPMIQSFFMAFQTGIGSSLRTAEPWYLNFERMLKDKTFLSAMGNTFFYLIIQVPIMLLVAMILAVLLNNKKLRGRGFFRSAIFLPCAVSLVSSSMMFRFLFSNGGMFDRLFHSLGILSVDYNFLTNPWTARLAIIIALLWRWTGYNMVFFLAGLQNIDPAVYEAAELDGAGSFKKFTHITLPLLKPILLLTTIMSTSGTLQLFDESKVLTNGRPANATITMAHYLWKTSFEQVPEFGYTVAMALVIFLLIAGLSAIQMKVGDKR